MNLIFLISIIYFLIPGAVANMMPVFFRNKWKSLDYPLDFGLTLNGKRILGENKTFRGLIAGIFGAIIAVYVQLSLYDFKIFRDLSLIDYSQINFLALGFLIGFGVLFGDAVASFIKRRLNVAPGKSLLIIDQVNGAAGLTIFVLPFYLVSWQITIYILVIWTLGHFLFKYLGYLFKMDNKAI